MIFPERLKALHARTPERVAVYMQFPNADDLPVTLDQLLRGSQAFAQTYAREGVDPGEVVVLILQHGEDLLYAFWGAILHGARLRRSQMDCHRGHHQSSYRHE